VGRAHEGWRYADELVVVLIFAMFTLTLAAGLYVRLAGCDGARPTAPRTRGI
jgi:hypothetical protein